MKRFVFYTIILVLGVSLTGCPQSNSQPQKRIPPLFMINAVYDTGKEPSYLVTDDFDADGHLDLVVLNSGEHNLSYLKGKGDGTFQEGIVIKTGADPIATAVADFNNDRLKDLAILNYQDGTLHILLNSGGGSFRNTGSIIKPGRIPINLTTDDFNGDGLPDLMVSLRFHKVVYLEGKGNGVFAEPVEIAVRGQPTGVISGDYNKDGFRDLAVALAGSGNTGVQILWGEGNGKFDPGKNFRGGGQPLTIANIDANNDGKVDLVTSSNSLHALTMVMNDGDKKFHALRDFAAGEFPKFIVAADFSGDGIEDLAVSNATNDTISVTLGRGDGTFIYPPVIHYVDEYPQGMAVGDFNQDGHLDLAVSCRDKNLITILLKQGKQPSPLPGPTVQKTSG
ncbi:FG-GAP repeat domain-containing protein [Nitrospina sp. 32_T5]|uniref:FG-GAP repeat domain-containing protein n=1 Tax=unclassified Nitrospina TaxID=2638683 RepID=UPI003F99F23E